MGRHRRIICSVAVIVASAVAPLVLLAATQGDAFAGGAPAISWASPPNSGAYDFGTVTPGQSTTQVFVLTNSGGSSSAALTVSLSGSTAFEVTADGCTGTAIGKNKSCTVTVRYAPAAAGQSDSATLTATGQKSAASTSVTLTGSGAGRPELVVTVTGPMFGISPGTLSYSVAISSVGTGQATNVTLTDATPTSTTFGSESEAIFGPIFACTNPSTGATGTTSCTIPALAAGASATFYITETIDPHVASGSQITDTATVSADGAVPDSSTATTTVEAPA